MDIMIIETSACVRGRGFLRIMVLRQRGAQETEKHKGERQPSHAVRRYWGCERGNSERDADDEDSQRSRNTMQTRLDHMERGAGTVQSLNAYVGNNGEACQEGM